MGSPKMSQCSVQGMKPEDGAPPDTLENKLIETHYDSRLVKMWTTSVGDLLSFSHF